MIQYYDTKVWGKTYASKSMGSLQITAKTIKSTSSSLVYKSTKFALFYLSRWHLFDNCTIGSAVKI